MFVNGFVTCLLYTRHRLNGGPCDDPNPRATFLATEDSGFGPDYNESPFSSVERTETRDDKHANEERKTGWTRRGGKATPSDRQPATGSHYLSERVRGPRRQMLSECSSSEFLSEMQTQGPSLRVRSGQARAAWHPGDTVTKSTLTSCHDPWVSL